MSNRKISKILIANRGEIAVRIIRGCRESGITTVAVYSEADVLSLHVRFADEAYEIGPAPSRESYLNQEKIIDAAKKSGADAVHPGYGFLAENPEFAQRVQQAGIIFIGPPPEAIRLMGDKTAARQRMLEVGVPVVPGTDEALKDEQEAVAIAQEMGFPVLLKAAAGGGGKGMRVVEEKDGVVSAFRAAKSEAESAFGDGRIYVEKYLKGPRHIEFQILADSHGNIIHLGERECSIQRRHQKIIEEAPSCVLTEDLRQEMGEAAVKAAKACGYENAGTIEFMLDKQNFYFLEMNTRLQVEHPVTEMVTGLDLVKEQIRIAAGEKLPYKQRDIKISGHAIECRIYAEDSRNNFLPSTGRITHLMPAAGPGIRDDNGFCAGSEVSVYYDPLLAKLIAWGRDRKEAIMRMRRALREYQVYGVETSIPFCQMVMQHEGFVSGEFDTHFVEQEFLHRPDLLDCMGELPEKEAAILAATIFHHQNQDRNRPVALEPGSNKKISSWKLIGREQCLGK